MSLLLDAARALTRLGIKERPGDEDHPFILWALERAGIIGAHDETAWCGAALGLLCDVLDMPTPLMRARARSWLLTGETVELGKIEPGDIVIFSRGPHPPPASVIDAPGHVAIFEQRIGNFLYMIGGNQRDSWCRDALPVSAVLGVRRL
jgi:hypothetical protein